MIHILLLIALTASPAPVLIDDFESYEPGQVIGAAAASKPWQRFGKATNDNVVATAAKDKVITGKRSAQYGLVWPNPFGAVRRVLDQPLDASKLAHARVTVSSDRQQTPTRVKLRISAGDTTWESKVEQSLPNNTLFFSLAENDLTRTAGKASYTDVITKLETVGLTFTSAKDEAKETITFDDIKLSTANPQN